MGSSVISKFNTLVILCIVVIAGILYSMYKDKITKLLGQSDTASRAFDKVCENGIDVNIPKGSLMKFKMPLGGVTLEVPQSDAMINVPVDCS